MAIVTFISDFGNSDHYVAAVKAAILGVNPNVNIVDISHNIKVCDIGHAAYVLGSVFRDFPKGTVHLVAVSESGLTNSKMIAIMLEDHFFVGHDNGIMSLISEQMSTSVVDINSISPVKSSFPAKDIFAPAAAALASSKSIYDLGVNMDEIVRRTPSMAKSTKKQIAGNIIRVDHYGNLITNIKKDDFDTIMKINGNHAYEVNFRKEKFRNLNESASEVPPGECFVYFNTKGKLEIGINQGDGSNLLGLKVDDQVFIDFISE
ncbi:MAG: SAM-dependent chlorinase/fluorinase [Cyclobacteriaceae bacterium]